MCRLIATGHELKKLQTLVLLYQYMNMITYVGAYMFTNPWFDITAMLLHVCHAHNNTSWRKAQAGTLELFPTSALSSFPLLVLPYATSDYKEVNRVLHSASAQRTAEGGKIQIYNKYILSILSNFCHQYLERASIVIPFLCSGV